MSKDDKNDMRELLTVTVYFWGSILSGVINSFLLCLFIDRVLL